MREPPGCRAHGLRCGRTVQRRRERANRLDASAVSEALDRRSAARPGVAPVADEHRDVAVAAESAEALRGGEHPGVEGRSEKRRAQHGPCTTHRNLNARPTSGYTMSLPPS